MNDRSQSVLNASGPAARWIEDFWWVLLAISVVVSLVVIVALLVALLRRRREENDWRTERRGWIGIVAAGAVVPGLILGGTYVYSLDLLGRLSPTAGKADLEVEVTGLQWWWRVRYMDEEPSRVAETANELHIPVGRRVLVRVRSDDVIHSFWVPALQGKMDLIPGKPNLTWIQADTPGVYRGQCAEYCGMQHAHMAFLVVAQPEGEFRAWLERQRQPAVRPADALAARGESVFVHRPCAICHQIRGTPARGQVAPDLTHVGSRRTLASGLLPNNTGGLAGWIANPNVLKPGTRMPRVPLDAEELQAVTHYLQTLK